MLKPGTRLKSAVCDAEVMVIKAGASDDLTCGGVALAEAPERTEGAEDKMHGCLIGKRYVNQEESIEVHIFSVEIDKNFYKKEVEVFFIKYLRNERKFKNLEFLRIQLKKDKQKCLSFEI